MGFRYYFGQVMQFNPSKPIGIVNNLKQQQIKL